MKHGRSEWSVGQKTGRAHGIKPAFQGLLQQMWWCSNKPRKQITVLQDKAEIASDPFQLLQAELHPDADRFTPRSHFDSGPNFLILFSEGFKPLKHGQAEQFQTWRITLPVSFKLQHGLTWNGYKLYPACLSRHGKLSAVELFLFWWLKDFGVQGLV